MFLKVSDEKKKDLKKGLLLVPPVKLVKLTEKALKALLSLACEFHRGDVKLV
jgi:hypothetical protein